MTIMLPTMRTMKTLDAPGLLLLPLGQRRIDDNREKQLAARIVMKSSKKDSTTRTTKSTMSMRRSRGTSEPLMTATIARKP
jgi:hypothetical protein